MERMALARSSIIESVGYDEADGILEIHFRNGRTYQYYLVPESVFRAFTAASSAGAFFLSEVDKRYPYRELP